MAEYWVAARYTSGETTFARLGEYLNGTRPVLETGDVLAATRGVSAVALMRRLGNRYRDFRPVRLAIEHIVVDGGDGWPTEREAWGVGYSDERSPPPPVDRSDVQLTDGAPVPEDRSHTELKPNGQQRDYVVLSDAERAKGFVRPYRDAYRHQTCGKITTMGRAIAETYARDPTFYSGTFCTHCGKHFPVGANGEFTWYEMDGREGPKVGT